MTKTVSGYLVDPHTATITKICLECDKNGSVLTSLRAHIGCRVVERHEIDADHDLWIDEEGWFESQRAAIGIKPHETKLLLAGRGVILSVDGHGDSVAPRLPIEDCAARLVAYQAVISADFHTSNQIEAGWSVVETVAQHVTHLEAAPFAVAG